MNFRVLSWNISYGYGMRSDGIRYDGEGYVHKKKSHFDSTLSRMAEWIQNLEVDILLLQEVDFDSHRSHHIHQLDELARRTNLLYRQEVISWKHPYVPYPGLNPKNHFQKISSGGGILSRFPLTPVRTDFLPQPSDQSRLVRSFSPKRYLQTVDVTLNQNELAYSLRVSNLHFEAFSEENRSLHLTRLRDRLKDDQIEIAGGDFNGALDLPKPHDGYFEIPAKEPTFPSVSPSRYLDGFVIRQSQIVEPKISTLDSGILSDHFPVLLECRLLPNTASNSAHVAKTVS